MPLNALVDSVDTLEESVRAHYKPVEDGEHKGKYVLDVAPANGYGLENVDGLKASILATKAEADRLKAEHDKTKEAIAKYDGLKLKPSEIASSLKRLKELEALDPESEADKRATAKLNEYQGRIKTEYETKLDAEKARSEKLYGAVEKLLVKNSLQEEILKAGGVPALLTPVLSNRIKVQETESGEFQTIVLDERGQKDVLIKDGGIVNKTIKDLVEGFKADPTYGRAFEASGRTGTGAPVNAGGGGSASPHTFTAAEWLKKTSEATPEDRRKLLLDAKAGKYTVTS